MDACRKRLVCIDPGHGGADPGAQAFGFREADLVLDYAETLARALMDAGHAVLLTRTEDRSTSLGARARIANEVGAVCFVSLHANANASERPRGFQTFHARGSVRGEALARAVSGAATRVTPPTRWTGTFPDESPQCGNRRLYVLRATRMPAVLVELGFLTNPDECQLLVLSPYRTSLACAVANSVSDWIAGLA